MMNDSRWIGVLWLRGVQVAALMVVVIAAVVPFAPAEGHGLTPDLTNVTIDPMVTAIPVRVAVTERPAGSVAVPPDCARCRAAAAVLWMTDAGQRAALS
ncbi:MULTISPECIES: hypothetical protein [unclassified Gordonia (in: high G+C Gram-positive bacteria)]|uniref:hypothetical protein n=1 Tax=unclassified Gordonia (in: high G+C Gram-positive bacteria) TaxID=2657482 RepID=UPI001F0D057A|nr:hypothetical protein [Gordonia sp. ABSL49_1]MCH5642122.1 hypothetical protein [Gordonia sp. ABSL49_1]